MPTITQLEYLLAVDTQRHFGKAAASCFVAQPSLSIQIQKLEEELDVTLFDRTKKPIATTEIGKEIVEQARIVLKEIGNLKVLADIKHLEPKGGFKLAVIPTLSAYLIPLFIGSFGEKYPKVNLVINEYKTEDIVKLLADDEIDAGLMVPPKDDNRFAGTHLFYEPFYCYIHPEHPLAWKKNISGVDLDSGDLWLLSEGHCFRNQVLKVCSSNKEDTILPNVHFESGNLDTLIKLVRTNSGYTLIPELALDGLSARERALQVKQIKDPVPTRQVSLMYNRHSLKQTLVNALAESIISNLPPRLRHLKKKTLEVIDI